MRDILVWGLPLAIVAILLLVTWWQLRRRGRKRGDR